MNAARKKRFLRTAKFAAWLIYLGILVILNIFDMSDYILWSIVCIQVLLIIFIAGLIFKNHIDRHRQINQLNEPASSIQSKHKGS